MLQFTVIGNLGANAEVHNENGNQFLSFRVGHNERRTTRDGHNVDETIWVSCVLNGDGGNLTRYLVKGQQVCVIGDGSLRVYHSEKQRRLVAGANLYVRSITLIGGKPDAVPSALFDSDGVQHNVIKCYYTPDYRFGSIYDKAGNVYYVDNNGWIQVEQQESQSSNSNSDDDVLPLANSDYNSDAPFTEVDNNNNKNN